MGFKQFCLQSLTLFDRLECGIKAATDVKLMVPLCCDCLRRWLQWAGNDRRLLGLKLCMLFLHLQQKICIPVDFLAIFGRKDVGTMQFHSSMH